MGRFDHILRIIRASLIVVGLSICESFGASSAAQPTASPDSAKLVTDDLRNFVRALEALRGTADTVTVLQREYFARATPGLVAYADRDGVTPQTLAAAIGKRPTHYASLVALLPTLERLEPRIRAAFEELERIHPDAVFPPVFFLVGDFSAGGLTRPVGLLISVETYAATPMVDRSEFPDSTQMPPSADGIPHLVTHELVHYQQAVAQGVEAYRAIFGERQTLLRIAIREGSADFLAELISGGHTNPRAHQYGLLHERELWAAFRKAMHQRDLGDWMFYRPANGEWPANLGYFMGYRIVQAFYESYANKREALRAILSVTDYEWFLRESGYAERFERR
jgi:hypothetical protein